MHEVKNASVHESDTNLAAERHLAVAMRFQAMSDRPLSGLVSFQISPVIWYELDELGRTPTGSDEKAQPLQKTGEDQPAAKAEAKGSPIEFGLRIDGKDYKLSLDNPHQAFLLEMLAAMEPGTTFRRSIALAHGLHPDGPETARETAFGTALKAVMQKLELMAGRPLVEATGSRGTRRYSLIEKIDITHRPESAGYEFPEQWDWSITYRRRPIRSSGASSGRQADVATESTVNEPAVEADDEVVLDHEDPRDLRSDRGLRLALCKMFGFDPDAPQTGEPIKPLKAVHAKVIARYFGLNGYAMMKIEEISLELDTRGEMLSAITPAAVRYIVSDVLKQLSPKPGDKPTLDVPAARAYLRYLDSQD